MPDDVQGGTFTITNPGGYGTFHGTPVISQPQAGILGTYAVVKRPWVVQDELGQDVIAIRPIMNLTLTYDHRLVDGALAGRFLRDLRKRLESWGGGDYYDWPASTWSAVNERASDAEWHRRYADQRGVYDALVGRLRTWSGHRPTRGDRLRLGDLVLRRSGPGRVRAREGMRRDRQSARQPGGEPAAGRGVGIGIETPYEIAAIDELVRREFVVDPAGSLSIDEAQARSERLRHPVGLDTLRYEYPYYLSRLDERRLALAGVVAFAGLKVRIELKTLLRTPGVGSTRNSFRRRVVVSGRGPRPAGAVALALSAVDADLVEAKRAIARPPRRVRRGSRGRRAPASAERRLAARVPAHVGARRVDASSSDEQVGLGYDPDYAPGWRRRRAAAALAASPGGRAHDRGARGLPEAGDPAGARTRSGSSHASPPSETSRRGRSRRPSSNGSGSS